MIFLLHVKWRKENYVYSLNQCHRTLLDSLRKRKDLSMIWCKLPAILAVRFKPTFIPLDRRRMVTWCDWFVFCVTCCCVQPSPRTNVRAFLGECYFSVALHSSSLITRSQHCLQKNSVRFPIFQWFSTKWVDLISQRTVRLNRKLFLYILPINDFWSRSFSCIVKWKEKKLYL